MRRLLIAGDTHGYITHCRYLAYQAKTRGCDGIVILGDFGFWEHTADGEDFLDDIAELAEQFGIPWFALDGNHDKTSLVLERYGDHRTEDGFLQVRPGLFYLPRGHRWTWSGVRFIALGGAYSVDKEYRLADEIHHAERIRRRNYYRPIGRKRSVDTSGTQWFPEEEMTNEDMAKILTDTSPVDVILAHDKPRSSHPGWNRKDLPECWPNQDRLQLALLALKPTLFLHGHLHYRYSCGVRSGNDTWCMVEGLDCNREAHEGSHRFDYKPTESWGVLDLSRTDDLKLVDP